MQPIAPIQKALKHRAKAGTPCFRSIRLTCLENISASSLANDHVILEAAKSLPTRVRRATLVIRTMKTVVAALDLVACAMISYRGTLFEISMTDCFLDFGYSPCPCRDDWFNIVYAVEHSDSKEKRGNDCGEYTEDCSKRHDLCGIDTVFS